ncbi:MAG TPA: hypothetical protein PKM59_02910 [Thermodesulfobacteriota bacterium]|nr:hypothetical protein [Deltaproteobacteria bacterium]HNR12245.1 hypothetical protein [Thermodesulfobacteriota bacterium]HNU70083.1 hypothetical protein [Thermodesulfobacteriota bacterium]
MSWIFKINHLSDVAKEGLYRILIPPTLFHKFRINPILFMNTNQQRLARFYCPPKDNATLIEVKHEVSSKDNIFFIQVSDTRDRTQINLDFLVINDPASERFNTDVDSMGRDTLFGRALRNVPEEIRAMQAGLAPGQVRAGLRLTAESLWCLEHFCRILGIKSIVLEGLFYHNAIIWERLGFSYFEGFKRMKRINELFQPGQILCEKLNGSTPFRQIGFHRTIRGRSWAIHDGILHDVDDDILEGAWISPKMYKMIENPRMIQTFPEGKY